MICHEKKLLFIHIPKTAGNAVQKLLLPHSKDSVYRSSFKDGKLNDFEIATELGEHQKHAWIKNYYEAAESGNLSFDPEGYIKFCVIRNPWERMVSLYCWESPNISRQLNEEHFWEFLNRPHPSSLDYIKHKREVKVDNFIFFKNFNSELRAFLTPYGIDCSSLELTNPSFHTHYSKYYSTRAMQYVKNKFQEEIEFFNFEFEGSPSNNGVDIRFDQFRGDLFKLCEEIPNRKKMVEIGSLAGVSTETFCKFFDEVISIDPYQGGYDPKDLNSNQERLDIAKEIFSLKFASLPHVSQKNTTSASAVSDFKNKELDLVYIDANHQYEAVKEDINLWASKTKYIGGHDWNWKGVKQAVEEAAASYNKKIALFNGNHWLLQ